MSKVVQKLIPTLGHIENMLDILKQVSDVGSNTVQRLGSRDWGFRTTNYCAKAHAKRTYKFMALGELELRIISLGRSAIMLRLLVYS